MYVLMKLCKLSHVNGILKQRAVKDDIQTPNLEGRRNRESIKYNGKKRGHFGQRGLGNPKQDYDVTMSQFSTNKPKNSKFLVI